MYTANKRPHSSKHTAGKAGRQTAARMLLLVLRDVCRRPTAHAHSLLLHSLHTCRIVAAAGCCLL